MGPVVLFKMVLIQHLYGLPSLRRTADEVSANICYRWFLGYTLQEKTPHFSTVSYNFRHRFTEDTVNQVFAWILGEADDARYAPKYRDLYKQRKETIERVFADAKEKHSMRYTQYRGLAQVTSWVKLKFAAMNLKKLASWKWKEHYLCWRSRVFPLYAPETRLPLDAQPGFSTDCKTLLERGFAA